MKQKFIIAGYLCLILLLTGGCQKNDELNGASFLEVFTNNHTFNGKLVMLRGFLGNAGQSALFLNEIEATIASTARIVVIDSQLGHEEYDQCAWSYVRVIGRYRYLEKSREHLFEEVRSIYKLVPSADGQKVEEEKCYSVEEE